MAALVFSSLAAEVVEAAPAPATWTGLGLEEREVDVLSLANGRLRYVDADRTVGEASLAGVVQLRFARGAGLQAADADQASGEAHPGETGPGDAASGRLLLTDGQALAGALARPQNAGPEALAWVHPTMGRWEVPLEQVAAVRMPAAAGLDVAIAARPGAGVARPSADEITLANGDVLLGFVAGVGDAGVSLEPDGGGAAATFPWSAVAGLRLANPDDPPPAGDLVALADGSRFAVAEARFDGEAWRIRRDAPGPSDSPGPPVRLDPASVASVHPGASGLRLHTLATLVFAEPTPARAFGVAFPARPTDGGLLVHAPTRLEFSAPGAPAEIREVRVVLRLSPEAAASALASVDVALAGGEPVRLSAAVPSAELRGSALQAPLRLVLGEAQHGAVLDRVVVESVQWLAATSPED